MKRVNIRSTSWKSALAVATLSAVPGIVAAQGGGRGWAEPTVIRVERGDWTGARLPDGQPDIQGFYSNTQGNHNNLTGGPGPGNGDNTEAAPGAGGGGGGRAGGGRGQGRGGPGAAGAAARPSRSRVSDPADGQVPFQPWARAKQEEFRKYLDDPIKPEYVEPFARCAPGGPTKSFMWHGYEIRQFPDYVLFMFDSGNRVIYLNSAKHLPENIKLWNGDSRGHWEGNTLVVDVANNNSKWRFGRTGEFVSETATAKETYTFAADGSRFVYDATWTDPTGPTRPFTISIGNKRVTDKTPIDDWNNQTFLARHADPEPLIEAYERLCIEGNGNHGHEIGSLEKVQEAAPYTP